MEHARSSAVYTSPVSARRLNIPSIQCSGECIKVEKVQKEPPSSARIASTAARYVASNSWCWSRRRCVFCKFEISFKRRSLEGSCRAAMNRDDNAMAITTRHKHWQENVEKSYERNPRMCLTLVGLSSKLGQRSFRNAEPQPISNHQSSKQVSVCSIMSSQSQDDYEPSQEVSQCTDPMQRSPGREAGFKSLDAIDECVVPLSGIIPDCRDLYCIHGQLIRLRGSRRLANNGQSIH